MKTKPIPLIYNYICKPVSPYLFPKLNFSSLKAFFCVLFCSLKIRTWSACIYNNITYVSYSTGELAWHCSSIEYSYLFIHLIMFAIEYTLERQMRRTEPVVPSVQAVQSRKKVSDQTIKYLCNQNTKVNLLYCLTVMEKQ